MHFISKMKLMMMSCLLLVQWQSQSLLLASSFTPCLPPSPALLKHKSSPTIDTSTSLRLVNSNSNSNRSSVSFSSPLLDEGYPPAVTEFQSSKHFEKPLLLYLPGFDGTLMAPFLQFPELGTEFDVRGMVVDMDDRSTVDELKCLVLDYIRNEIEERPGSGASVASLDSDSDMGRHVYIMGESFGGILALEVALAIQELNLNANANAQSQRINLQGVALINPATSYNRSNLAKHGPPVTTLPPFLYPFALLKLIPLFTDAHALPQLLLILQSKGLPSIIDNKQREAYMGRMAFSIPDKLKFMPQQTLKWRLDEWLTAGCSSLSKRQNDMANLLDVPVLIVVGEKDHTLPSMEEADRLKGLLRKSKVHVHVVQGSGHACTSGSRVDLTALMRGTFFPNFAHGGGRTAMKGSAACNEGDMYGLEERYDGANIGLLPVFYWSHDNYQKIDIDG